MTIKCINEEMTELINKQERWFSFFLFYVIFSFHSFTFFYTRPSLCKSVWKDSKHFFFWNWKRMIHFFSPKTWQCGNFLRKMEFPFVLCGVQFASGIILCTCLKSCGLEIHTMDLYESTVLEGSFSLATSKSFTLSDLWWVFIV